MLRSTEFLLLGVAGFLLGICEVSFLLALFFVFAILVWRKKQGIILVVIFFSLFCLGVLRINFTKPPENLNGRVEFFNHAKVERKITGYVERDLKIGASRQDFDFWVESVDGVATSGRVKVFLAKYPRLSVGTGLVLTGEIIAPPNFEDFDYKNYLAKEGIFSVSYYPQYEIVERDLTLSNHLRRNLDFLKFGFLDSVDRIFPEESASLISAVTVGDRGGMSDATRDAFSYVGLAHMIALSGLHIALLLLLLDRALFFLPRRFRIFLELLLLVFFVIMVGASASVVRAGLMGGLTLVATIYGRRAETGRLLLLVGFLMLLINPLLLFFDVGFQLSFLAVLGILFLYPYLFFLFKKIPCGEILALSLAATLLTAPLVVYNFGVLSLISPLANVLGIWVLPFVIAFGFLAGILGMGSVWIGKILGFVAYLGSEYLLILADWLVKIPYAYLLLEIKNPLFLGAFYLIIWVVILGLKKYSGVEKETKKR